VPRHHPVSWRCRHAGLPPVTPRTTIPVGAQYLTSQEPAGDKYGGELGNRPEKSRCRRTVQAGTRYSQQEWARGAADTLLMLRPETSEPDANPTLQGDPMLARLAGWPRLAIARYFRWSVPRLNQCSQARLQTIIVFRTPVHRCGQRSIRKTDEVARTIPESIHQGVSHLKRTIPCSIPSRPGQRSWTVRRETARCASTERAVARFRPKWGAAESITTIPRGIGGGSGRLPCKGDCDAVGREESSARHGCHGRLCTSHASPAEI